MHALLVDDLELSWGDRHVLQGLSLTIAPMERVGIVGPNGCGKSTLLAIMAGRLQPDTGRIHRAGRVAILEQNPGFVGTTVEDVVQAALSWHGDLSGAYEQALNDGDMDRASELQMQLDEAGWVVDHKIDALIEQTGAPPRDRELEGLSGGEQRRLALAATLLAQPDVLLLDEPTNHLDALTIAWLEKFLNGYRGAVILVTHDRYLLEAVCTRIVEIEQGKPISYDGSYADYLIGRAERHALLHRTEERRLNILARESAWAARSPAARSTKQQARLKRLEVLEEAGKLPKDRRFSLDFSTGMKTSGTFLEIHGLQIQMGDRVLIQHLDLAIRPGDRLGIVGPNGAGKSTLLYSIMGDHTPRAGQISRASRVKIGLLDQARTGLNPNENVFEAAGGGNDQVLVGDNWIHVASFLNKLLFEREQFGTLVSALSGGERARLLLAKKMLEGNAVLLLDEPTNDLDLWTLAVLEEALLDFDGAALIVTHDRAFLDRVCTGVVAFEPHGQVTRYAERAQADRAWAEKSRDPRPPPAAAPPPPKPAPVSSGPKLSWKEAKELEGLPDALEQAEAAVAAIEAVLADPATYKDRADEVPALTRRLEGAQKQVETLFNRWEELSARG